MKNKINSIKLLILTAFIIFSASSFANNKPSNLNVTNVTETSFTLNWTNAASATGVNVFIKDQTGGDIYIATFLGTGIVNSYTYSGTYTSGGNSVTIQKGSTYLVYIEGLPDPAWDSYNSLTVKTSGTATTVDPESPKNLRISGITDNSFTLTWDKDLNATIGTNVFIDEPAINSGNLYIATLAPGVNTYTYQGAYGAVTINKEGIYTARLQALPDDNGNAYAEIAVNMKEPGGTTYIKDPNFHIYLCFGQSNMYGSAAIETQDRTVDSRFRVLQSVECSNLGRIKDKWYTAVPPLSQCFAGLSPADYFGRTMVENLPDSIKIGIINVAIGGSDIRLFDKDIYKNYDSTYIESWFLDQVKSYNGNPYQHLVQLAKVAQQSGVIKGILLHQGETNNGDVLWPNYVKKVYNNMLADLNLSASSVPLLAGEVVGVDQNGVCAAMNTIINKLPETIPTAHVISSVGCTVGTDKVHFNSAGVRELGKRYATKMLTLKAAEVNTGVKVSTKNKGCALLQNYPNPFDKNTCISFEIPNRSFVSLKVFDLKGVQVAELAGKEFVAGKHIVNFGANFLSAGTYFYTLKADEINVTRKMIVLAS